MTEPYTAAGGQGPAPGTWNGASPASPQTGAFGMPQPGAVPGAPTHMHAGGPTTPAQAGAPGVPGMPPQAGGPVPPVPPVPFVPDAPAVPKWYRRPVVRTVGRWAAALLICAGAGTGTAFGITAADRTDVPGLATASDGRWDYPKLSLPALPAGRPRPFAVGNTAEIHYADIRDLLLPAPHGGTVDKELDGGWVGDSSYLEEYAKHNRARLRTALDDLAVRHIAARGWTMSDGTSVRVYLLQFSSTAYADYWLDEKISVSIPGAPGSELVNASDLEIDDGFEDPGAAMHGGSPTVLAETKPYGATQTRAAYLASGDIAALVVAEKKGGVDEVPFDQTVILQSQLLE